MKFNSFITKQLHEQQKKSQWCFSQQQISKTAFSFRKHLRQIIINPERMGSQQWKSLNEIVAQLKGVIEKAKPLVDYLKKMQAQVPKLIDKTNTVGELKQLQLNDKIARYFLQPIRLQITTKDQNKWKYHQLYLQSQELLKQLECCKDESKVANKGSIALILLLNKSICCLKLQMYRKALETIEKLNGLNSVLNSKLQIQLQFMKNIILVQMGCKICYKPKQSLNCQKGNNQYNVAKNNKNSYLCFEIISFDRQSLKNFIYNLSNTAMDISIQNFYNLALVCKRFSCFKWAETILRKIIESNLKDDKVNITSKCYILLSEIDEERGNFSGALESINRLKVNEDNDKNQMYFRKLRLQKKIKIQMAPKTCPSFSPREAKQFTLLCNLQNQLRTIVDKKQNKTVLTNKNKSKLYQIVTHKKKATKISLLPTQKTTIFFAFPQKAHTKLLECPSHKLKDDSMQSTRLHTRQEIRLQNKQVQPSQKQIKYQAKSQLCQQTQAKSAQAAHNLIKQNLSHQTQAQQKKSQKLPILKVVKFQTDQQQNEKVLEIIYKGEQKIASMFMSDNYEQIAPEISIILQNLRQEIYCSQIDKFILKCVGWYRQLSLQNQAISLLTKTIKDLKGEKEDPKFKKQCLKLLGEIYSKILDSKNAISVYLQLANLGEIQYYDKLGELQLIKQHFSSSIKYYEIYHQFKLNLYSQSKLAHAYSKLAIYKKKAIDLLNQMLFQNKNLVIFRHFEVQEIQDVQNAVLLLVSIYMNHHTGTERAKTICEKFLQINFSAYPVYYLLGVMLEQQGEKQEAFKKYLTALKLKPNHLPSLIRIVNDIGIDNANNYEIINILRKSFVQNNRNWQLLQLLIQGITLAKEEEMKPTVQELVRYAKILQKAEVEQGEMDLQIQIVWTWAYEVMQQRRRREQVVEDANQNEINMKLGQINMIKGNFRASEFFLKKVLNKLELRRKRTERRKGMIRLELQVLERMSYIKLRQNESEEAKVYIDMGLNIAKNIDIGQREQIQRRLMDFTPKFCKF